MRDLWKEGLAEIIFFPCLSPRAVALDLNWVRELGRDYQQEAEAE